MRRFPWALTVFTTLALAILLALGVWQLRRLDWKQSLIERAEHNAAMPVAALDEAFRSSAAPEFRRVVMDCPGLSSAPFVELRTIQEGLAGVRLISACRPARSAHPVLVDRGFISDEANVRPVVSPSDAPTIVAGEVRLAPRPGGFAPSPQGKLFYARDNAAMATALGVGATSEHFVYATVSANPEMPALRPSAPPAAFSSNHLGYAATWFGLAIVLLGVYIALLIRRLKS